MATQRDTDHPSPLLHRFVHFPRVLLKMSLRARERKTPRRKKKERKTTRSHCFHFHIHFLEIFPNDEEVESLITTLHNADIPMVFHERKAPHPQHRLFHFACPVPPRGERDWQEGHHFLHRLYFHGWRHHHYSWTAHGHAWIVSIVHPWR